MVRPVRAVTGEARLAIGIAACLASLVGTAHAGPDEAGAAFLRHCVERTPLEATEGVSEAARALAETFPLASSQTDGSPFVEAPDVAIADDYVLVRGSVSYNVLNWKVVPRSEPSLGNANWFPG